MPVTRPALLTIPFANAGGKTDPIPDGAQPLGRASYEEGFPPLTRTPIAAGGIPPSGLDMNGVLFALSAHIVQQNAGLAYYYDAAFATAEGGYDEGALLLRADDTGFWFNTVAANETDPDAGGAGWIPAFNAGSTVITGLTNANVTLTALQYSKSIITLAGTLTGNINLVLPAIVGQWIVANNTTGNFTITAKTAAGTGVVLNQGGSTPIWGDATNIYASGLSAAQSQSQSGNYAVAGGTANAITASFSPRFTAHVVGMPLRVKITAANTSTAVTFAPNGISPAVAVLHADGTLPNIGDFQINQVPELSYDGTAYRITAPTQTVGVFAQCYLQYTNTTTLTLTALAGNLLWINGVNQSIPGGGISYTLSGLASSTLYYVYAYMNAGVMTLELSTTGYTVNANNRIPQKTGDVTRTLVGMARTTAGTLFAYSISQRFVASYFNRRGVLVSPSSASSVTGVTTTSLAELATSARSEFVAWAGDALVIACQGYCSNNTVNQYCASQLSMDGTGLNAEIRVTSATANALGNMSHQTVANIADGYHYLTVNGAVGANTGAWASLATSVIFQG